MKILRSMLAFSVLLSVLLVFPFSLELPDGTYNSVDELNNLQVRNLNTGKSYSTIQEAINAPETLDGQEIFAASGTYYEHITLNKSLSLVGEDRDTTFIDGNGAGTVVYVSAENVIIRNFTIQNGLFGLWLDESQNSKIIGNTLQKGSYGIRIHHSRNVEIADNNVYRYTKFGVEIYTSGNSTLRNNKMNDNKYNIGVDGKSLFDFINAIDTSNTVNGKPIRYLINQHNVTIDSSTFQELGYLALVNSTNIKVRNLSVRDNIQGVLFAFTENSTISNVNAMNNWDGIYVAHSRNISVSDSNSNQNFDYGIKFFNSSRSLAFGNNVDNNGWAGIGLFRSPNSTVDGNEANFNTYNLHIVYTNNSVITRNNALSKTNGYSIAVYYSHNNIIYHNMFINSLLYVETRNWTRFTPRNSWNNSLEGNFWISYGGIDTDLNGIGDTPYVIGENNIDNHPLMGKFSDFSVTLKAKTYTITIISNSTISQFQFNLEEEKVSFIATDFNETTGFSRVAFPNALLQELDRGNLTFWINSEHPLLQRKWTDGVNTFLYFSYVNRVSGSTISPWLIVAVASVLLVASLIVFFTIKKQHRGGPQLVQKRSDAYGRLYDCCWYET